MSACRGIYVTGTDTDVGKTRVAAAVARAWKEASGTATIVKLVQTGLAPSVEGDAAVAGRWAGTAWRELGRFRAAADPWSAALAEHNAPLQLETLLSRLRACPGPVVVEGSGGAAVPLDANHTLTDVAAAAGLPALVVVGLRLGCLNHALLTIDYLKGQKMHVAGLVCVERWQPIDDSYRNDVRRVLAPHAPLLGFIGFDHDPQRSTLLAAPLFAALAREEPPSTPPS